MKRFLAPTASTLAALCTLAFCLPVSAAPYTVKLSVEAGKYDRSHTPVSHVISVPKSLGKVTVASLESGGKKSLAQLTAPSLLANAKVAEGQIDRECHFVVESLKAGEKASFTLTIAESSTSNTPGFSWHDNQGVYNELRLGSRPVLRYMYQALDDSTPEKRLVTYKVFHHLFNPVGDRIVTNGPDGHHPYLQKQIRYPHHRGLFYGFNRCSYEGVARADLWHCQGDNFQSHEGFLAQEAGPVVGRHRMAIDWHGKGKEVFVQEEREMGVYNLPDGQLVEFASRLTSKVGNVKLDGDPQHAGFQFRAHNEVAAKTGKQTYYLRVNGKGEPGKTTNWPQDKTQVNLPWKAMSIVLGDTRYTAAYLDKPTNPKEARFSERDYGRFGSYFVHELEAGKPLEVSYRVWFQEGEMTGEQVSTLSSDFVDPPKVSLLN